MTASKLQVKAVKRNDEHLAHNIWIVYCALVYGVVFLSSARRNSLLLQRKLCYATYDWSKRPSANPFIQFHFTNSRD